MNEMKGKKVQQQKQNHQKQEKDKTHRLSFCAGKRKDFCAKNVVIKDRE
jgi:hypothetical protein